MTIEEELGLIYDGESPFFAEDVYFEINQFVKPVTIRKWAQRIEEITKKVFYRAINEKNIFYHKDKTIHYDYVFFRKDIERFKLMVELRKQNYSLDSAIYHSFLFAEDYEELKQHHFDFKIFWDKNKEKLLTNKIADIQDG